MARDALFDQLLLSWIKAHDVREQKEIQDFLQSRGYALSQSTLSRHLKRLTISKVLGVYKVIKENTPFLASVLEMHVSAYGMIVLHTHPGQAGMVAHFLDQRYGRKEKPNTSGILGTLAGDDTVLVIVKNKEKMTDAVSALDQEFPYIKKE